MKITENNIRFNRYRGMIFLSKSNLKVLLSANLKVYKLMEFDFVKPSDSEKNELCFSLIIAFFDSKLGQGVHVEIWD